MNLPRRKLLHLAAGLVALPMLPRPASAQVYPSRPVRIVAAFAAGGGGGITARPIGPWVSHPPGKDLRGGKRTGGRGENAAQAGCYGAPPGPTLPPRPPPRPRP